ncbi:hypothetical protein D3C80_1669090 [compost metagenome]
MRTFCIVMIPVELRRNIHAQLVVAHPADVIKQVIIGRETETRTAVKTVTFIAIFAVVAGHILELWTNTAAYGEVEAAQRITRLRILLKNGDFRLCCERHQCHCCADRCRQRCFSYCHYYSLIDTLLII